MALYYKNVSRAEADRRRRGDVHLRREEQSRTAADRRGRSPSCPSIGGRDGAEGQASATSPRPRWSRRSAPAPTASRSSSPAARPSTSASPDYWGKDLAGESSAVTISTRSAIEYFRDSTVLLRGVQGGPLSISGVENSAQNWATAYDFPAVPRGPRRQGGIPDPRAPASCRCFVVQPAARQVQGPARAARLQPRLRFRGDEQDPVLRPVQADRQLLLGTELASSGPARRARSSRSSRRVRDKVPPDVFTTPYKNPVNGSPEAVRNNLREAVRLLQEAGYELEAARWSTARPASRSPSSS